MTEEKLSNLTINQLTEEQYMNAKANGEINENELYMTLDDSSNGDNGIIASSTEPTVNRRKVWFRTKGKNLFDGKYNANYGYDTTTGQLIVNNAVYSNVNKIEIQAGATKICLSKNGEIKTTRFFFYDNANNLISHDVSSAENLAEIPSNAEYCNFQIGNGIVTENDFSTSIQVEVGTDSDVLPTNYEAYINPSIFIKNDNNIYEEFIKKQTDSLTKLYSYDYNNETYGHHVQCRVVGKCANIRFWNWGETGQIKANESYTTTLPFSTYLYIQGKYIEVQNNKLTIKKQEKDTWHEDALMFLIR